MSAIASSSRLLLPRAAVTRPAGLRFNSTTATSAASAAPRRRRSQEPPKSDVDLIAPPDPLSNIRPVIYASLSTRPTSRSSPYSTSEFPYSENDASLQDLELEWRLSRERVDMMNHRFWATTNAEFNAQLAHRLARLPPFSDPPMPAEVRRREDVLSQFYADWQANNREKQGAWVRAWWSEIWAGLKMQSRVHIARLMNR